MTYPIKQLSELADIYYGKSPTSVRDSYGAIPIIGTSGITGFANESLFHGPAIIVGRKGTLDNPLHITGAFWPIDTAYAVIPKPRINSRWLYYYLKTFDLTKLNEATGVPSINRDYLGALNFKTPSEVNQNKIASIIDAFENAGEIYNQKLTKQQRIKTGLMQDLLTKGIDEQGNIRSEETHEFKDSPLGRIPIDWECKPCKNLCTRITVGIVVKPTQYYAAEGVPAFRSANIREDGITSTDLVFFSEEHNRMLSSTQVKTGDVLSVRTGYPGTSAVVTKEHNGSNAIDILISTPNKEVLPEYLCFWINSFYGKEQVLKMQGGVAQQHFNVSDMQELLVATPEKNEQQTIVEAINFINSNIINIQEKIDKCQALKKGLMQDLLSGNRDISHLSIDELTQSLTTS